MKMDNTEAKDRAVFFSKLARITGSVRNLEKDATNKFHKYDYVSADNVLHALAPLMAEENIALLSETLEVSVDDKVYMPKYRFTFVCGDTGYMHPCIWYGETIHTSKTGTRDDKALNKSATISQKYFLLKTFMIATGDDPDGSQGDTKRKAQQNGNASSREKTAVEWNRKRINGIFHYWLDNKGLTEADVMRFADITNKYDAEQWAKYPTIKDASAAIQTAFNSAVSEGVGADDTGWERDPNRPSETL
jgi:hypothetical protein